MDDIIGIGWRCRCGFEEMGTENTWWYEQHTVGSKHIHKVSCNRAWLSSMDCQHPPTWAGVGFVLSRGKGCHDCGRLRWSPVKSYPRWPWLDRCLDSGAPWVLQEEHLAVERREAGEMGWNVYLGPQLHWLHLHRPFRNSLKNLASFWNALQAARVKWLPMLKGILDKHG